MVITLFSRQSTLLGIIDIAVALVSKYTVWSFIELLLGSVILIGVSPLEAKTSWSWWPLITYFFLNIKAGVPLSSSSGSSSGSSFKERAKTAISSVLQSEKMFGEYFISVSDGSFYKAAIYFSVKTKLFLLFVYSSAD